MFLGRGNIDRFASSDFSFPDDIFAITVIVRVIDDDPDIILRRGLKYAGLAICFIACKHKRYAHEIKQKKMTRMLTPLQSLGD